MSDTGKIETVPYPMAGDGPFPAVLVMHENRGLNPYLEDVARRAAVAGFLALAPDGLAPIGGYPGNDDDGRAMQASLDRGKLLQDMVNSARFVKSHELSNGKLGATGFCWGGGTTNFLATELGEELARRGHEVHFISYERPFRMPQNAPRMFFHPVVINDYELFKYPDYTLPLSVKMAEVSRELGL